MYPLGLTSTQYMEVLRGIAGLGPNRSAHRHIHIMNFNNLQNHHIKIDLNGQIIKSTNHVTFLGININPKLNWKEHTEKTCTKVNRFSFALYKLTKVANINTAITAYFAYVESVLRYGLLIWGNGTDIQSVFIAQKRCIRSICNIKPDVSCKPYFKLLNILPLPCLYILEVCTFVMQNKQLFLLARNKTERSIRHANNLAVNFAPNTTRFLKNCFNMSIKIFNKIPNNLKTLPTNKFKHCLRNWLLEKMFYSIDEFLTENMYR